MFNPKQILQNRYQLQQKLGNTAAGRETWLAIDLESKQQVIVKLLAFSPQMQWEQLKLFERESQVLKNINHPRIPRYRDYFFLEEEDKIELPWFGLVEDYIPGASLNELLEKGKIFTAEEVRFISIYVLNILITLHELSPPVLHRDIKPSNLILGRNKEIYLVDFGAVQDKAKAEGVTFTVVGTSGYAPPEQLWGKAVASSDLYALGATLIHLLTGVSPAELPQERMRIQFRHLLKIEPDFANWIEQLIQPAPEKRFSTARQALSALPGIEPLPSTHSLPFTGNEKSQFVKFLFQFGLFFLIVFTGYGVIISMASMLSAGNIVKQSEAKTYVGSMNRAQQAYYLEKHTFTSNIAELGLGIKTETTNYSYSINTTPFAAFSYATSHQKKLKGYVGAVFLGTTRDTHEATTFAILCEAKSVGTKRLPNPIVENGDPKCAPGTENIYGSEDKNIVVSPDYDLAQTAINYAAAGNIEQSLVVIQTIKDDFYKGGALVAIAPNLRTTIQYNQAIKIAKNINIDEDKYRALSAIESHYQSK